MGRGTGGGLARHCGQPKKLRSLARVTRFRRSRRQVVELHRLGAAHSNPTRLPSCDARIMSEAWCAQAAKKSTPPSTVARRIAATWLQHKMLTAGGGRSSGLACLRKRPAQPAQPVPACSPAGWMTDAAPRDMCEHGIQIPARISGESTVRSAVPDNVVRTFTVRDTHEHTRRAWLRGDIACDRRRGEIGDAGVGERAARRRGGSALEPCDIMRGTRLVVCRKPAVRAVAPWASCGRNWGPRLVFARHLFFLPTFLPAAPRSGPNPGTVQAAALMVC